jgi:hypothetical protein
MSELRYRLTYHGDNHPDLFCERDAWVIIESSYRSAGAADLLMEKLAWGFKVHVRSGVLEKMPEPQPVARKFTGVARGHLSQVRLRELRIVSHSDPMERKQCVVEHSS